MASVAVDVAVVGAGPVGSAFAALAAGPGLEVALFESKRAPAADRRTLALSHASRERLEEAGAWPASGATAITSIHVSQKGGPGRTLIEAGDDGLPALGYTIGFSDLARALDARLEAKGIRVHRGEACEAIDLQPDGATVGFASGLEVRARLLVLADGGANAAKIPGIAFHEKDYGQQAVIAEVRSDKPHGGRAYERFTPQGPVALLPVADRFALIWTAPPSEAERILSLDDAALARELQAHFGDRAGRFEAPSPRSSFALRLRAVNVPVALRTAIVGNAAQALHPIAGQGLNLGLRDAAGLARALREAPPGEAGSVQMLARYRDSRVRDASRGIAFTDFLVTAFSDARRLPTWARGLALTALDLLPPARRVLAARMMRGAPAP